MSRGRRRNDDAAPRSIDLHIEELVLHGFGPADGPTVGDAVRAHIAELLASRAVPASLRGSAVAERLDPGSKSVPDAAGPDAVGAHIARSVYEGLTEWRP